jgi:hypothetical protein
MKSTSILLLTIFCWIPTANLSVAGEDPGLAVEARILDIEMDALMDVYGDVFREVQKLRMAALRLELEARESHEEDIEKEARRVELGVHLMERRLGELREEIHMRVARAEEIRHEHHRRMEDMEAAERAEQRHHEERERAERDHAQHRNEADHQHERMRMRRSRDRDQPGREIRVERQERHVREYRGGESDKLETNREVEVKVFVDGREIEVEIEDEDHEDK